MSGVTPSCISRRPREKTAISLPDSRRYKAVFQRGADFILSINVGDTAGLDENLEGSHQTLFSCKVQRILPSFVSK
eukprot:m.290159 g.290159  ORF g.290159 m.290159 type:complete len:76 (-) comp55072_c0_seq1:164-391(-)